MIFNVKKRIIKVLLLPLLLLCGFREACASDYGPACQWLRVHGKVEVEVEPGFAPKTPILLTVTYQFDDKQLPSLLLSSYPLQGLEFFFVLSGFAEQIENAVYLPFPFGFDKEVTFKYFATAANGRHRSEVYSTVYHPQRVKHAGKILCQTDLLLETMKLKRKRF